MGYRNYIGEISRSEYDRICNMSKDELYADRGEEDYVSVWELVKELHEFGKYIEFGDPKFMTPFFNNKELHEEMTEEHDFYIVGANFLLHVIDYYKNKVIAYYDDMLKGTHEWDTKAEDITPKQAHEWYHHLRKQRREWGAYGYWPFTTEKGETVVTSWLYEYSIFELVRIHNSFDWENKLLVYYGY